MSKINQTVARALADQIHGELYDASIKANDAIEKLIRKDPLYSKIKDLRKQKDKIHDALDSLEKILSSKYKVRSVSVYDNRINIDRRNQNLPTISVLRSDIIIANHMEGVTYENMKKHILKKYS